MAIFYISRNLLLKAYESTISLEQPRQISHVLKTTCLFSELLSPGSGEIIIRIRKTIRFAIKKTCAKSLFVIFIIILPPASVSFWLDLQQALISVQSQVPKLRIQAVQIDTRILDDAIQFLCYISMLISILQEPIQNYHCTRPVSVSILTCHCTL